jgi:1-acyl-sn-glycerol-3-phosphate acyltransferase
MEDWKLEPARDLGMPLDERAKSLRRESGLMERILHFGWWVTVRGYFGIWHRMAVEGRENLPAQPPFVCVANHASHLDALALGCALPRRWHDRIFPIAAGDTFFHTPAVAIFAAFVLNALPMWRRNCGSHGLQMLRERLVTESCIYILFPEGTRARDGQLGPFKPGLGMMVAETAVPVVPCHLEGAFGAFPPHARAPRPAKVRLRIGKPLFFKDVKNDREGWVRIAMESGAAVRALRPV